MSATVTICIPTYNRSQYLREAIQSVLNQTYTNLQILVCDNASTDDTPQVVRQFTDPRVKYHRHPSNIGIGANHRFGAEMADTPWVGFLSDDDLLKPSHVENSFRALEKYPQATYYACALKMFGEGVSEVRYPAALKQVNHRFSYYAPAQAVQFLGLENPGFLNTIICKKSAFHSKLFWGKRDFVHMDVLVMTQLMAQGGFVFDAEPSVLYRCHETNISSRPSNFRYTLRLACMISYAVRYLAKFLTENGTIKLQDIENHGMTVSDLSCARALVFGLGSWDALPQFRSIANRIFMQRRDIDQVESKFGAAIKLARKFGFWVIPSSERFAQYLVNWKP